MERTAKPGTATTETMPRHVLVVDDERQILDSLSDLLEDEFEVHATDDGEVALKILADYPVSVIITDQRMPKMEGDELLARAAEMSLATRVLLTGYADLQSVTRAVNRSHIYAYIAKPWDPIELQLTVARAADHHDLVKKYERERLLLHELLENIPDAIFFKDRDHRFTRVNRAKARLLGYDDPADIEGMGDWDFFPPDEALRIQSEDRRVTQEGKSLVDRVELYSPPHGQPRWFTTTKVPSHLGLVGISRDITARRLAEQKVESMNQQLIAAEIEKKTFCRDVVLAVTQGKFHLVESHEFHPLPNAGPEYPLADPEDCAGMRRLLEPFAREAGMEEECVQDLLLIAGEAATNTVKHAVGGRWQAGHDGKGVWVRVWDTGGGIHANELPRVLFKKGYSSKISLGLGYTLMLSLSDEMLLATDATGTTLQFFKSMHKEEEAGEFDDLLERFT